jgi:fructose-bisphosphate aldolase class II
MQAVPQLPLVLHGASGISDEDLKRAAATNVCKINVDTELRAAFERAVRAYFTASHEAIDPRDILGPAREAVQAVVEAKIRLFGSTGRARYTS